ncbi:hypothetical protein ACQUSY_07045 [Microbacterium sp. YY-03]|uniref:hypothetical protein n=1 Tax=Microbacterium sp. YY-03 TaxID=3421636 RepID=UPI003D166014
MTDSPPIPDTGDDLTWACVEDGFYVASDRNGFVGYIDRVEDDSFQVCNASSQQLGFFRELTSAMDCLVVAYRTRRDEGSVADV